MTQKKHSQSLAQRVEFLERVRRHTNERPQWTPAEGALLVNGVIPPPGCKEIPDTASQLEDPFLPATQPQLLGARRILREYRNDVENGDMPPDDHLLSDDFLKWCKDSDPLPAFAPKLPEFLRHLYFPGYHHPFSLSVEDEIAMLQLAMAATALRISPVSEVNKTQDDTNTVPPNPSALSTTNKKNKLLKLEQQIQAIEAGADAANFPRMNIPEKGKQHIENWCRDNYMNIANAQARYDDLSAQRAKRELRASVKGIALRPPKNDGVGQALPIQVGQKVTAGAALVEVASVAHVHALARVEESDLHVLHEGMNVRISGDGFSGLSLTGRLLSIGAQAIPSGTVGGSGTYDVIVDVAPLSPEQQKLVRLGMSARLNIVTYTGKNSFVVPVTAIRKDKQGNTVVSYRPSLQSPSKDIQVTVGKIVPLGVEVIGLSSGYVLSE